jgi:hypothetical protein
LRISRENRDITGISSRKQSLVSTVDFGTMNQETTGLRFSNRASRTVLSHFLFRNPLQVLSTIKTSPNWKSLSLASLSVKKVWTLFKKMRQAKSSSISAKSSQLETN